MYIRRVEFLLEQSAIVVGGIYKVNGHDRELVASCTLTSCAYDSPYISSLGRILADYVSHINPEDHCFYVCQTIMYIKFNGLIVQKNEAFSLPEIENIELYTYDPMV